MQGIYFRNIVPDKFLYIKGIDIQISNLNIHTFLTGNLWIYHVLLLVLLFIAIYQYYTLKNKNKKILLNEISEGQSPLIYRNILNSYLSHTPNFIYIKDKNLRFTFVNEKLARTVGAKSWKELIGKTDYDFYTKELADSYHLDETEVINSGKPILYKLRKGPDENGNEIWVNFSKIPIRNQDNEVVGIIGIGKDITTQKLFEEELKVKTNNLQEANMLLGEQQEEILQQQEELKVQTEKILSERNNLRTLIDAMPDSIYFKDRKSRFIVANNYVAEKMGTIPEYLIGKTDFDFYEKELAEEFYNDEQRIMNEGKPIINKEEKGGGINDEMFIVSTTKIPLKDEKGNIVGIVGIGRDITKQKEVEAKLIESSNALKETNVLLEERQEEIQQQSEELQTQAEHLININNELEKLSIVASKTDNVVIIIDREGNFEWVNAGFEKRYGLNLEEFTRINGKNIKENSGLDNINEKMDEIFKEKKALIYDSRSKDINNNYIWSQTTMSPVLDENNEISKIIIIDADITKLKEAEDKIIKNREEIEAQHEELKQLNATKDKFFSIIAHDLKNPFHSIIGFSDLLSRNYDSIEDNKKLEFISLIKESSIGAYALLENLLDWARTQTNKIKYNPDIIDLSKIIKQNYQMINGSLKNKNIHFVVPEKEDLRAFADVNMVNTIIRNLLSNAVKFTADEGTISISAEPYQNNIKISVADTGIGMSKEEINKLFKLDEFHTTKGTSGESGTGLGLIISREFALKHGSDLEVTSAVGKGTKFSFKLPLEAPES